MHVSVLHTLSFPAIDQPRVMQTDLFLVLIMQILTGAALMGVSLRSSFIFLFNE